MMPIEIPRSIYDRWVTALTPLAAADVRPKSEGYPDGGRVMSARPVLTYLQGSARITARGDIVVLDPGRTDEARARDVIRNAERLTGIRLDESAAER